MATSCTDFDHPYYKQINNKSDEEAINFFTEDKGKRMRFVSLGEAIDFISHGGGNFVYYPLNCKKMTKYIRTWMKAQRPRIEYDKIPLGENSYRYDIKKKEYFYLWNRFDKENLIENEELPRINYEKCPRNGKHAKTIEDLGGRLRCAHTDMLKGYKEGFTEKVNLGADFFSATERYSFDENKPEDPSVYDDETDEEEEGVNYEQSDYIEYLIKKEAYDNSKELEIKDTCYSVIKEPSDLYLPLETILNRLNCRHTMNRDKAMILPFSGFTLANYVKAWWEQPGRKIVWKRKKEIDFYNHFRDFELMGTD